VQFPFGYGLSYTTFAYDNLQVLADHFDDVDGLTVTVDVSNTGPVAGKEIVQVYVRDHESRLVRPDKELKGFAKVELQPGEIKSVAIPLDFRAFAYYDPAHQQWVTEDGQFDILVGASSADIRCCATVTLHSTLQLPSILHDESTVRAWVNDPVGRTILQPILEELMKNSSFFSAENSSHISMDMMNFMLETPLRSFFHFLEGSLTQPPDDITDMLVEQLHGVKVARCHTWFG
jgi:beta-glucosidase